MRFYRIFILVTFLLGVSISCTDLDESLNGNLTQEDFLTASQQTAAVGAAFSAIYNFATHNSLWSMQEVSTDEMIITQKGSDWFDGGQWIRMHAHDFNPTEESFNNAWNLLFGGINDVNRIREQFELSDEDDAELLALRGYYYWRLLDSFGNVPIILSFTQEEGAAVPTNNQDFQTGRNMVFNQVEADLLASLDNISVVTGSASLGRMNEFSVRFILAKLYLNAEVYLGPGNAMYEEAEEQIDLIINSGNFSLELDFFANTSLANEGSSSENIFEIPYDQVFLTGFNFGVMTLLGPSQATFNFTEQPWNGYSSLQEFYESYEEDDVRINGFIEGPQFAFNADGTVVTDDNGDPVPILDPSRNQTVDPEEQVVYVPMVNELEPNGGRDFGVRIGKWDLGQGQTEHLNNNFGLFRYSDVLLMKAEVMLRQGESGLAYVNMVRDRAGVAGLTELTEENLLAERGRELFAEGWRRQDLIRFGEFTSGTWQFKEPSEEFRNVFPIPDPQIQVNQTLTQNPGYSGG